MNTIRHTIADVTSAPVEAGAVASIEPEFVRLPDLQKLFGIKRSHAYALIEQRQIKSISLRRKGAKHGIRLISVTSVRAYLNSQVGGEK